MNKKVLVITLVLVMAFANSAMAAVTFSGKFTATATQNNFKIFQEKFTLEPGWEVNIGASNKNATDDVVNWDFSAGINLKESEFQLGKYKLGLYDDYFKAWVWGNKQELSDKATYFNMIKAGKTASTMRARLEVPVMDLATVTADFADGNTIRLFVNGKVEEYALGLAYARKDWDAKDPEKPIDVIVAQAGGAIPAGDLTVNAKAAAGIKLGENLGMAFGFSADTQLTEELEVEGSVTHANDHWAFDALTAKNTVLNAGATYTEAAYQVTASVTETLIKEGTNKNEISLGAKYRFSDKLGYGDLFKGDKWYTNDAPAVRAFADLIDLKLDEVGVEVAAPVVDEMIWAKAYGKYGQYDYKDEVAVEDKTEKSYKVGADLYIKATPKLVVTPFGYFEGIGKVLTFGTKASYAIGSSDTKLSLEVKKVTAEDILATKRAELIKASISVPF